MKFITVFREKCNDKNIAIHMLDKIFENHSKKEIKKAIANSLNRNNRRTNGSD